MIQLRHLFLNYVLFFITAIILCGIQSTLWFQITGGAPAPLLWLTAMIYIALFRKTNEAIIATYALCLVITSFSAIPIGLLWASMLCVDAFVFFVKSRVFWPSTRYFVLMSGAATLVFHISYFCFSHLWESNPANLSFFYRAFEILQTPLWAAPLFWLYLFLDRVSQRDPLPESAGVEE